MIIRRASVNGHSCDNRPGPADGGIPVEGYGCNEDEITDQIRFAKTEP